jgi:hypothetical protein
MAGSVNAPFGMRPVESWSGNPWNGATRILCSEDGNDALYVGDPLFRAVNDAKEITGRYMAVDQLAGGAGVAAVTNQIMAVMVSRAGQSVAPGVGGPPELLQSDSVYIPGDTDGALLNAVVDANVVHLMQSDAAMVYTDAGKNADCVIGSGSTATGLSGFAIGGSSAAADGNLNLLVIGLWDDPSNLVGDTYSLWNVLVNIGWFVPGGYTAILGTLGV